MERKPYQRYQESFKLEVVKFYFDNGGDRKMTLEKYGVDHSCLRDWLRRYGNPKKVVTLPGKIEEEMARKFKQLPAEAAEAQKEYERLWGSYHGGTVAHALTRKPARAGESPEPGGQRQPSHLGCVNQNSYLCKHNQ